jgi:hypothetical protein
MCPRFIQAKIRPGDLIWSVADGLEELFHDNKGGTFLASTLGPVDKIAKHEPCLCLAVVKNTVLLMSPRGLFGWSHRAFFERVGTREEQEWENLDGSSLVDRAEDLGSH